MSFNMQQGSEYWIFTHFDSIPPPSGQTIGLLLKSSTSVLKLSVKSFLESSQISANDENMKYGLHD